MNKLATILCISTVLLFSPNAKGWSGAGHQVIAAEAYRQLPPSLQKKVTELLKAHPDYEKWEESFRSESPNLDLSTFIFMRSSTWADEIRRRKSPYNHPKWHFVDYPLRPTKFPLEPGPDPTDDILYGIGQCEKTLADPKASPEERAVYLSWLIHLIGDEHMPLHCCSLFTSEYPAGFKVLISCLDGLSARSDAPCQFAIAPAPLCFSDQPLMPLPTRKGSVQTRSFVLDEKPNSGYFDQQTIPPI